MTNNRSAPQDEPNFTSSNATLRASMPRCNTTIYGNEPEASSDTSELGNHAWRQVPTDSDKEEEGAAEQPRVPAPGVPPSILRELRELPENGADVATLITLLSHLKAPTGVMPMPSSDQAPRFKGNNLRSFLEDYNMATGNAGWTNRQKCKNIYMYCNRETRNLVRKLGPQERGNWKGTIEALHKLYIGDEYADKYSRDHLDKFVSKKRTISRKKEFVKYFREFTEQLHGLRETITNGDRDCLFWKGLPQSVQQDIYIELIAEDPKMDRRKAASMESVHRIALSVLDKNSLYAGLTASWSDIKRRSWDLQQKKKRSRASKLSYDSSDNESSSSEEDNH